MQLSELNFGRARLSAYTAPRRASVPGTSDAPSLSRRYPMPRRCSVSSPAMSSAALASVTVVPPPRCRGTAC